MPGLTDYTAENVLNYIVGKAAVPALPTTYVALFTVAPSDAGTGGTEVSGGSYARAATTGSTWNAASASSGAEPATTPASISNNATVTFATPTGGWGNVIGVGLFDALTGGNLLAFDYLGNYPWRPATMSSASPGVITSPAHGFINGDLVVVTTKYGGNLPTVTGGSLSGTLTVANATTDTFTVGANTSTTGDFMVRKIVSQTISTGVVASFAGGTPGALVINSA